LLLIFHTWYYFSTECVAHYHADVGFAFTLTTTVPYWPRQRIWGKTQSLWLAARFTRM
jgi:hypothetical protein